jgi:outer membrane lipoprotein-sorting protein
LDLIATRFSEVDSKLTSLQADFKQVVSIAGSASSQHVVGDVRFKKPDYLYLTHTMPENQTIVSDGSFLWVHRCATNQVIQTRLATWKKNELVSKGFLDLGTSAELLKRYEAVLSSVSAPDSQGYRSFTLTLTPKSDGKSAQKDASFSLMIMSSTKDFFPSQATLRVGETTIQSTFERIRFNPLFAETQFRFTIPTGADVYKTPDKP